MRLEFFSYAMEVDSPEVRKSLMQRRAWLMSDEAKEDEDYDLMLRSGISRIEGWLVDEALKGAEFIVAQ